MLDRLPHDVLYLILFSICEPNPPHDPFHESDAASKLELAGTISNSLISFASSCSALHRVFESALQSTNLLKVAFTTFAGDQASLASELAAKEYPDTTDEKLVLRQAIGLHILLLKWTAKYYPPGSFDEALSQPNFTKSLYIFALCGLDGRYGYSDYGMHEGTSDNPAVQMAEEYNCQEEADVVFSDVDDALKNWDDDLIAASGFLDDEAWQQVCDWGTDEFLSCNWRNVGRILRVSQDRRQGSNDSYAFWKSRQLIRRIAPFVLWAVERGFSRSREIGSELLAGAANCVKPESTWGQRNVIIMGWK